MTSLCRCVVITDVGEPADTPEWPWSERHRAIGASSDPFTRYLATASADSVVVVDTKRHDVQCEWRNIQHGDVMLWLTQ